MLKDRKNSLIVALLGLLVVAHGCGTGISKTVEAAEITSAPLGVQGASLSSVPSLQLGTGPAHASGVVGQLVNVQLQAAGGKAPYSWGVASGSLPAGLAMSSNGTVSGSFTTAGSWTATLRVTDSENPVKSVQQQVAFQVTAPSSLTITGTTLPNGQVGVAYSTTLQAIGGTPKYSWSLAGGQLPAGLSLSSTGVISGTPTAQSNKTRVLVAAQDSGSPVEKKTQLVAITIVAAPVTITSTSIGNAQKGAGYSTTLHAAGGNGTYVWGLSSGSLPAGLTLSAAGTISGTPTNAGTSNFAVAVHDTETQPKSASANLAVTVTSPTAPLSITTGPLPTAQNAVSYGAQLSASGGTPGYTWTITSGSLPSGLSLQATTGAITGTPTGSSASTFTYSVTDNGAPQQSASATVKIQVNPAQAASAGTTWFIRSDGGSRYSQYNTTGQCDGKADTPYPGKGYNQHCAFNDVRYMWLDVVGVNAGWVMAGGDTLVIRGCSALSTQQNPDAPHCRVGWDNGQGNSTANFWCWYADNYCSMPSPPSGTATQHTRILGGCAYDGNCNPVIKYPYTNNNLAQLFAGFEAGTLMNLQGSKYIDLQGLEMTTHNGKCARYGATHPLPSCLRGGDRPLSDAADQAIWTNNATSNILLQDVYIHGFNSSAIVGPIGGPFTLTRVSLDFNTFAGWNFDDGSSTPNAAGASITQSYVTMIGNGCQEEYPIVHTQFPAKGCWDTTTGGFGDSWSGQNSGLDAFSCDHCTIMYNTKDAALGPHTQIGKLSLTNSYFGGNMGQQGKWGMEANSSALIANNLIVGNCDRMSLPIPGAGQNFNVSTGQTGSGLAGFCRAAGDVFAFYSSANSTVQIANNTLIALSPTVFDLSCGTTNGCASTPYRFTDNIFLGYTMPSYPGSSGQAPGLYYRADASVPIQGSHNLQYGVRNGDQCGQNGTICADPGFINEPAQGSLIPETLLDNFNFHLTSFSPALGAGTTYTGALTADYFGTIETQLTLGAVAQ